MHNRYRYPEDVPRTRGDEPTALEEHGQTKRMFPAHAGMNRS